MNEMLQRCQEIAPVLTAIDPNRVADLLERIDAADTTDAADNWQSILSAAEATARSTMATMHDIGDVNTLRADHLRIVDRPFDSESVNGAQREQDAYAALSSATMQRKRSKRGAYTVVTRNGRSLVAGDTYPHDPDGSPIPAVVIEHALDAATVCGPWHDGIRVAKIATLAYDLPDLIGGEFLAWSEVLPDDVSAGIDAGAVGTHTTGAYDGNTRHTYRAAKFPTRVRLPLPRERKDENLSPATVTYHDGQSVTTLTAPADGATVVRTVAPVTVGTVTRERTVVTVVNRPDHVWHGHTYRTRPETRAAQRRAMPNTYAETFTISPVDPLAELHAVASFIGNGTKVRWHVENGLRGTLARSAKGRLNATVNGTDVKVNGARTVAALVAGLAPAFN